MKKRCWLLLVGMLWALVAGAQTPLGINYQGVARAADGTPLSSRNIGLRISITNGPSGSVEYEEEQHPTTNEFGLFAIVIGQGQSSGSLADVDWSTGNKWLQVELDPDDNGNYTLVGSQQLMSVPYALYARNAGNGLDPGFGIDISNGKINNILPDQVITLSGTGATTVSGTYPNFIINSTDAVDDADADPANELQTISKTGSTVTLSNGGGSFTDAVDDADNNPTNEYNTAGSFEPNNTIRITDGGGDIDVAIGPLNAALDAGGQNITNLADPVNPQDAVTRQYLEQVDATDYAISIPITYTSSGIVGDVTLDLSGFTLDKGNLISGTDITIAEDGVYAISVQGFSNLSGGSDIDIRINGSPTAVLRGTNNYLGFYLFDLVSGDQIQIVVRFGNSIETITLQIAVYKI